MDDAPPSGVGTVIHYVTGDSAAFAHTARVIGGVAGEIKLLPVTELNADVAQTFSLQRRDSGLLRSTHSFGRDEESD